MRRLGAAALVAILLSSGSATARPALAADPWAVTASTGRVTAVFAAGTSGTQTIIALENHTSIAGELRLGLTDTFWLKALGLSGSYSQTAVWPAGAGPGLSCPVDILGTNTSCLTLPSGAGATLIPGSARAGLIAKASAAGGQTLIVVGPNVGSVAYDLAYAAIGAVFDSLSLPGIALDAVLDLALTIRPEANIVLAALLQGDLLAAREDFLSLMGRVWDTIKEKLAGLIPHALITLIPFAAEIKFAIAVAKALAPLENLVAASMSNNTTTVTLAYAIGSGPTASPTPITKAGTFTPAGSMATARAGHTATPLSDGRVLIVGGLGASRGVASAELYDPNTGTFSPTGSMATGRASHFATLLVDGRVLVGGGSRDDGSVSTPLRSAELYDPNTGTFKPTGSMSTERVGATAALLEDGRVLVAGGLGGGSALASAELYDPNTGTFKPTGSMFTGRELPTLTVISGGLVLVVGGNSARGYLASAELYDPATGLFTTTGSMTAARAGQTATLLANGDVLVAAGWTDGYENGLASAELYEWVNGTFSRTGSMAAARGLHTATLLADGRVLVVGGVVYAGSGPQAPSSDKILASAELYDWKSGTFTPTGSMATPRFGQTATLLADGEVLLAGGAGSGRDSLASAELYGSSSIVFSPSTLSCSNPAPVVGTVRYPSWVKSGDLLSSLIDGRKYGQSSQFLPGGQDYRQQLDGSWVVTDSRSASDLQQACGQGYPNSLGIDLSAGAHTIQVVDSNGAVLAQGTYTVGP